MCLFALGIAAWKDENGGEVEGFSIGESIHYRIWDSEGDFEAEITEDGIEVISGENVFTSNGFLVVRISGEAPEDVKLPDDNLTPIEYSLSEPFPNPFNSKTRLNYDLPEGASVKIQVFDLSGRLVITLTNGNYEAGHHYITWDAKGSATGIYLVQMIAGEF